jgi:hypothetical protein
MFWSFLVIFIGGCFTERPLRGQSLPTIWLEATAGQPCSDLADDYQYSRDYLVTVPTIKALTHYELRLDVDRNEVARMTFDNIQSVMDTALVSADFNFRDFLIVEASANEPEIMIPGVTYRIGCVYFDLTDKRPLESSIITRHFKWNTQHIPGFEIPDIALNTLTGDFSTGEGVEKSDSLEIAIPPELDLKFYSIKDSTLIIEFYPILGRELIIREDSGKVFVEIKPSKD